MFARLNGRQLKRNRTTDEVSGRLPDGWFPLPGISLLHRSALPVVHRVEGRSGVTATVAAEVTRRMVRAFQGIPLLKSGATRLAVEHGKTSTPDPVSRCAPRVLLPTHTLAFRD